MAGRKQFDEESVLENALLCFWENGCHATSMSELEAATGLNKSSIYNTFGSKAGLLEQCLERFSGRYTDVVFSKLEGSDIHEAMSGFVDALAKRFARPDIPRGCLATMTAMEEGHTDSPAGKFSEFEIAALRRKLHERFEQAVDDRQLPANADTAAMAALFLAITRGLAVIHRGSNDKEIIADALSGVHALIENPPRKSV